ncbi:uncharacterized protein BDZ99DRAFT_527821 [Mytilinidion resinicola]|uniref:BTB domain-containing protein n=1 Tax=Mytilinidion resinicola TaxID=574789 RepID=A0A6A6Y0S4_9PEZI|nr:uncharacterized protein BDZ99DRAFT_527821 [Mytilinidion resinicola]KAF2802158.1 hypothetical protein BDZ99DRAFT_527821 [Mytilinidion resinicola]
MALSKGVTLDLAGYLDSAEWSDLEICHGADSYKVHCIVMCSQLGALRHPSVEMEVELKNDAIDLSHEEKDAVASMVQFAYNDDYDNELHSCSRDLTEQALHHVRACILAFRYKAYGLRNLAANLLKGLVEELWSKGRFGFIVEEIYENTKDPMLRNIAVDIVVNHYATIALIRGTDIHVALSSVAKFSQDCFTTMCRKKIVEEARLDPTNRYKFSCCGDQWPIANDGCLERVECRTWNTPIIKSADKEERISLSGSNTP